MKVAFTVMDSTGRHIVLTSKDKTSDIAGDINAVLSDVTHSVFTFNNIFYSFLAVRMLTVPLYWPEAVKLCILVKNRYLLWKEERVIGVGRVELSLKFMKK